MHGSAISPSALDIGEEFRPDEFRAAPSAASLIESMRDIGYTLESALADVLDNAITAGAKTIQILHDTASPNPYLAVLDDGSSMGREELLAAMRPGSVSPKVLRASNDLGRFGLGLKTASFSQARELTVVCKRGEEISAARWDLDHVVDRDDWLLLLPPAFDPDECPGVRLLERQGTAVIWRKLDRLVDATSGASNSDDMLDRLDSARRHLELVFHRFLAGEADLPKVRILMNGRELKPFDPFNSSNVATQRLPVEPIKVAGRIVKVEAFILPHHGKVSASEWDRFAGEGGYLKNQGFYIYRGGRLIIHGTWFRLARQSELTKLARVKIDMPNDLDSFWKIDVRKSSAQPPFVVRERLKSLIEQIAEPSRRVFTARGHRLTSESRASLWHRRVDKGQISYEINREHPLLSHVADALNDEQAEELETFLKSIERSFPVDAIFSDAASDPKNVAQMRMPDEDLEAIVRLTIKALIANEFSLQTMLTDLQRAEPYRSNWAKTEGLIREIHTELTNEDAEH